jgi:hypothetical protein
MMGDRPSKHGSPAMLAPDWLEHLMPLSLTAVLLVACSVSNPSSAQATADAKEPYLAAYSTNGTAPRDAAAGVRGNCHDTVQPAFL